MTLSDKQKMFARLLPKLLQHAFDLGFEVSMGECWRPSYMAQQNAQSGIGIIHSLHCERLAVDINLFKNGIWMTQTSDHLPLGEYWESLSTQDYICKWGGRFSKPDGNHYSIANDGVA